MSAGTVLILSIFAAIIPTVFFVSLIYWVDRYEKEPWWLLTAVFLWGAIPSIIIAFIFNSLLSIPLYIIDTSGETANILAASFIAPPVEETIKALALVGIFFWWRHEIDSLLDGIIYGAMVGMGFAMVENVYYFVNVFNEQGLNAWEMNILVRGIIFGLNHALFSSMTGLGLAAARLARQNWVRITAPLLGWSAAVFLHFLHNFTVSFGNLLCLVALASDWGGVWLLIAIIIWALIQERRWIREYLKSEVSAGVITFQQYQKACSTRERASHHLSLFLSGKLGTWRNSLRFYQRCSELAYKKHHYQLFGDEQTLQLIEKLRAELMHWQ